ncbi:hypothetical protein HJC23_002374 [Cyclotella cryptica]|uniref:Uncharacterized protein n=1 Tax=Cyclotella cryptica TaxID=29204 RepID=A0ABD3QNC1_9STRA|eukprot:CCRYP_004480-RA/>CCRYP_004480-RA protein AED:0.27 eAED:0.27 QI:990/1/1/1/1/1/3/2364/850
MRLGGIEWSSKPVLIVLLHFSSTHITFHDVPTNPIPNTQPSKPSQTDIVLPVHGRNKPIALGQVGLRCRHCKDRLHTKHAVTYPTYISSIYNSVKQMFRLHFDQCDMIPVELKNKVGSLKDSTANRGGRKQYWVDSAKRLGLVDTSFGIHFGRDPHDPLPPLGGPRDSQMPPLEEDERSQPSLAEDGSPLKIDFYGSQDVQEPEYYPLVLPEDKPLISDYLYLALEQMQPANLMDADRVGCYKGRRTGFPGLACKHCVGQAGCGRYFPASEASLSQTTTSQTLVNHVRNCRRCPIEVREELELMKRAKGNYESKNNDNKPRHGGRKVFFHRLWCRIQRIPLPKHEKIEDLPQKTPNRQKSLSSPSSSGRKRKKSVDTDHDDEETGPEKKLTKHDGIDVSGSFDNSGKLKDATISTNESHIKTQISPAFHGSIRLARGDDSSWLSDACCFIRSNLVEAFTASEAEVDDVNATSPGQVGVRCLYCAKNLSANDRPKGHVHFPSSVAGIQDAVSDLNRRHLQLCNEIPSDIRDTFRSLKGFGSKTDGDTAQYWVDSAKELGLCDYEGGRGEVMFFRNPHESSPADLIDIARKTDAPTASFIVRPEDRDSCTDHIVLLLKQFTPCRFEPSDRRGGSTKSRDRAIGFPGLMCIHCHHKRYFPVAEKKVSDTTNLMMTHITNCFSSPMQVKASLCYLQHRSLIQKSQLMGNWKITFFKRVWDRLHHQNWDESSLSLTTKSDAPSSAGVATAGRHAVADSKADEKNEANGEDLAEGITEEITETPDSIDEEMSPGNADALSKMRGLIRAAALWLTERDVEAEARIRSGRGLGSVQTVRPAGRGGRGRGGRGRGGKKG